MALRPLIAIFGTTGVGKSNLAIQLALHISKTCKGARIINADAMQVYAGLDLITNKVPDAERHGVEHLLMGFKQPGEQYVVGQWVKDAIRAVSSLHIPPSDPQQARVDRRDPSERRDPNCRWGNVVLDAASHVPRPSGRNAARNSSRPVRKHY
jgi:hypothetical protein